MTDETHPNQCEHCDRSFANKGALISHLRTHNKQPDPAPYPGPTPRFDTVPEAEILPPGYGVAVDPAVGSHGNRNFIISAGGGGAAFFPGNHAGVANFTGAAPAPNFTNMTTGTVTVPSADVTIKVKKLPHYGDLPNLKRATLGSAAFDLYAAIEEDVILRINGWDLIPTGLAMEIPLGWVGKVVPRSGLAWNSGITIVNTPGIIDSDYRGELKVNLVNNTTRKFRVQPGMRIAQILFERSPTVTLQYVDELSDTDRGTGGFGSTGA